MNKQRAGAFPVVLCVVGALAALTGVAIFLAGLGVGMRPFQTYPSLMLTGGSVFAVGLLFYAAGDAIRSLRITAGRTKEAATPSSP